MVSLVCDSGNKYLSKVYNDYWMIDQGFIERETLRRPARPDRAPPQGARGGDRGADETVLAAYQRMKLYDVSQLPVLEDGKIVGIVDEEDILLEVIDNPAHFREPVTEAMERRLVTVPPSAPVETADGDLQARAGGDRGRRRRVPRPHHAHRPPELAARRRNESRTQQ